ncbi:hypothetical protein ONZ45_g19203 [Pleurotus djamor]|nr:hypothetical protein ONZ45_g19203 [Pleurotus djamor]
MFPSTTPTICWFALRWTLCREHAHLLVHRRRRYGHRRLIALHITHNIISVLDLNTGRRQHQAERYRRLYTVGTLSSRNHQSSTSNIVLQSVQESYILSPAQHPLSNKLYRAGSISHTPFAPHPRPPTVLCSSHRVLVLPQPFVEPNLISRVQSHLSSALFKLTVTQSVPMIIKENDPDAATAANVRDVVYIYNNQRIFVAQGHRALPPWASVVLLVVVLCLCIVCIRLLF